MKRPAFYHVALSFAGEDREYVDEVAKILRRKGVKLFYDRFEEANLWGKNLYEYLNDIYQHSTMFTIAFLSQHYARKLWTNHERTSAQARAFQENSDYILPVRFDDTVIPGILPTTGYIEAKSKSPNELAELVIQKLASVDIVIEPPPRIEVIRSDNCRGDDNYAAISWGYPEVADEHGVRLKDYVLVTPLAY